MGGDARDRRSLALGRPKRKETAAAQPRLQAGTGDVPKDGRPPSALFTQRSPTPQSDQWKLHKPCHSPTSEVHVVCAAEEEGSKAR